MLTMGYEGAERIAAAHRAKFAYVYVRQSTAGQVRQHQESTELQYRLVDRAAGLGWPRERITTIDEDLGKSGTSSAERQGFQRLIASRAAGCAAQGRRALAGDRGLRPLRAPDGAALLGPAR